MKVFGINPVVEALRAGRVTGLTISNQRRTGLGELLQLAREYQIRIKPAGRQELDQLAGGQQHQGVVATVRPNPVATLVQLTAASDQSLIVVLDGIEDPHNFGAIARVAEAAGGRRLGRPNTTICSGDRRSSQGVSRSIGTSPGGVGR